MSCSLICPTGRNGARTQSHTPRTTAIRQPTTQRHQAVTEGLRTYVTTAAPIAAAALQPAPTGSAVLPCPPLPPLSCSALHRHHRIVTKRPGLPASFRKPRPLICCTSWCPRAALGPRPWPDPRTVHIPGQDATTTCGTCVTQSQRITGSPATPATRMCDTPVATTRAFDTSCRGGARHGGARITGIPARPATRTGAPGAAGPPGERSNMGQWSRTVRKFRLG